MSPTTSPRAHRDASAAAVVAVVGDLVLTGRDVDARELLVGIEAGASNLPAPGSPEARRLRRWLVHTLVEEAIVEAEAASSGTPRRTDPAAPLAPDVVRRVFETVTADVAVTEDEIESHYRRNLDRFVRAETRTLAQVVLADHGCAARLAAHAHEVGLREAGAAVPGAVVEHHDVIRGQRGAATESAVFGAAAGDVVGPLAGPLGWLVAELLRVRPRRTTPLAEVSEAIASDLWAAKRGRRFDQWLAQRRRRDVRLMPGSEHPGDPRVPERMHRH
ncbi:peptidyl-prolyl cis-trans isomerase [Egicoccus sp. AB-alg6-2]|uniref:peptidylprolyl isomerase n=1 Tax=Egicoccus sp. AB-alg6-2 TaxID=3242692 RepID=UPI00359ECF23